MVGDDDVMSRSPLDLWAELLRRQTGCIRLLVTCSGEASQT